jgi:nicotinamide-nucleotide amidase
MAIIFIGKEFKYRDFLQNYILSRYKSAKIYFFDSIDFGIETTISKHSQLLIVSNEKSYPVIAKVIATLNDDNLELRDNQLIPSKTIIYQEGSFIVELSNKLINVIKVTDHIPTILLDQEIYTFHILNYDLETADIFVKSIFESFNVDYTIYMNEGGWCEIKTTKINPKLLKQLKGFIPHIIVAKNIFEYIQNFLISKNKKLTFAESCTGGLIASYFTKVAGSSKVFDGSVVSYANSIKYEWLGVDERVLQKFGAVSEEVVQQMLLGILEISGSDYAIAVSGIAGPDGATPQKPVGTVFIGVGDKNGKFSVERLYLKGDREQIQYQTLMHSIRLFIKFFNFL